MQFGSAARWAGLGVSFVMIAGLATCSGYYLPSTEKVHVSGTEIKRRDAKEGGVVHDVRYILAQRLDGSSLVFRNEDTGWGFPFYFKFDAADLSGEAQNIASSQREAVVLVTYYGVRSRILDLYPNVVGLRRVDPSYVHVPIFNIVFFMVSVLGAIALFLWSRRTLRQARERWRAWRNKGTVSPGG